MKLSLYGFIVGAPSLRQAQDRLGAKSIAA